MSSTVFAEGMGFFHKGSGGQGIAPGDVCLSPPPPPAGPAPVPYVNQLTASTLADGSSTVKIEGQPTALEDKSYTSSSSGDEGGTQGGNVVTHRTKGKGYFKLWSFTVQVEGLGVCRHGDMMGQNCGSTPPGCVDMKALVSFLVREDVKIGEPCAKEYNREKLGLSKCTPAQYEKVKGGPCWECQRDWPSRDYEGKSCPLCSSPGSSGRQPFPRVRSFLHGAHIGCSLVLMFDDGDLMRSIVMRRIGGEGIALAERPGKVEVDADGERLVVPATEQLVLRCGKAGITLTKAGKIMIRGAYVASRSFGVNRVKRGSLQLN